MNPDDSTNHADDQSSDQILSKDASSQTSGDEQGDEYYISLDDLLEQIQATFENEAQRMPGEKPQPELPGLGLPQDSSVLMWLCVPQYTSSADFPEVEPIQQPSPPYGNAVMQNQHNNQAPNPRMNRQPFRFVSFQCRALKNAFEQHPDRQPPPPVVDNLTRIGLTENGIEFYFEQRYMESTAETRTISEEQCRELRMAWRWNLIRTMADEINIARRIGAPVSSVRQWIYKETHK